MIDTAVVLETALEAAVRSLPKLDDVSGTKDGISLLNLKSHLLLSYLEHLAYYILLKVRGESIQDEQNQAAVEALIDLRVYLDRGIKPIEQKLKYQMDKVIRAAERADREGGLENLDAAAKDALAYKPNPGSLVVDKANGKDAGDAEADDIYRPPKIASVLPAREAQARRRQPNRTLRDFVDSELSAAPVAEPSIGTNIVSSGRQGNSVLQSANDRSKQAERDRYEEENYTRLPSIGKQKKGRRSDEIYGGEDFRVLDQELYDFQGPKESLLERSRKRGVEDPSMGSGPTAELGLKFKKRKKALRSSGKRR
jgi:U3 small nucleolar ribonucleoprotein protein LCP5